MHFDPVQFPTSTDYLALNYEVFPSREMLGPTCPVSENDLQPLSDRMTI
jgi:hypothetical protein